jgi:hypothetical protein
MSIRLKVIISYIIIAIVMIGLASSLSNSKEKLKETKARETQNLIALSDTVSYFRNANGDLVASKALMQMTLDELFIANDSLAKWVKEHKDSILVVTQIETKYIHDTIIIDTGIVEYVYADTEDKGSDKVNIFFEYDNPQIYFNSLTSFGVDVPIKISNPTLLITDLSIDAGITTAIVEDKEGIKRIEVVSDNPNLKFTNITGNIVPEDQVGFWDKFGFGVAIGPTANYDVIDKNFSAGIGITAGFVYKKVKK